MPRRDPLPWPSAAVALAILALLASCSPRHAGAPQDPARPPASLASVALAPDPVTLAAGGTAQLTLTGTGSDGATADVTRIAVWRAEPPGVVSVSAGGLVTALVEGVTTVTGSATLGNVTRAASAGVAVTGTTAPAAYDPGPGWTLGWSDEFSGDAVDPASWTFDLGEGGWGNQESEYYQPENAEVAGGFLTITARREQRGTAPYTSARLQTARKRTFTYGKIAMRAKLPSGQGMWPAFWMLGANTSAWDHLYGSGSVAWPGCGEIDVMEMVGGRAAGGLGDSTVHGTLHYLDARNANPMPTSSWRLAQRLSEDFHVYEIVWTPEAITWKLDGYAYGTQLLGPDMEEFQQPFFILLNLAVGGSWPGWADETTVFPQRFVVDWVRVYDGPATVPGSAPGPGTTWHLSTAAPPGLSLAAESLTSIAGTASGFQPTRTLDGAASWVSPAVTGTYAEGAWSVGLWTASPGAEAVVRAELIVTAADGTAPRSLGTAEVDVNATAGGNHLSWLRIGGVRAQTLANERVKLVLTQLGGPPVTLAYNGNDFDSRLVTPPSAASP